MSTYGLRMDDSCSVNNTVGMLFKSVVIIIIERGKNNKGWIKTYFYNTLHLDRREMTVKRNILFFCGARREPPESWMEIILLSYYIPYSTAVVAFPLSLYGARNKFNLSGDDRRQTVNSSNMRMTTTRLTVLWLCVVLLHARTHTLQVMTTLNPTHYIEIRTSCVFICLKIGGPLKLTIN